MENQWQDSTNDLTGKEDAFTGQPLDPTRALYRCECGVYYHDSSYEAIQRDRAGQCNVCSSTLIRAVSSGTSRHTYTSPPYTPPKPPSSQARNSAVEDFFGTIADYITSVFRLALFGIGIIRRHLFATFVLAGIIVISYEGRLFYKSLLEKTNLSFGYTIDGKDLPAGIAPEIQVDGQPFANGSRIGLGSHELKVTLQDAEPFSEKFWVFGAKNLGLLPLESSKGSLSVTVNPLPATVELKRDGIQVHQGNAPLKIDQLPVGSYAMVVHRGDYFGNVCDYDSPCPNHKRAD